MPCVICLESKRWYQDIRKLKCKHRFHLECINRWSEKHRCCPICRCEILPQRPISFIELYISSKQGGNKVDEILYKAGIESNK
jgi:E3 ubiquitin-protein ligase RHA2